MMMEIMVITMRLVRVGSCSLVSQNKQNARTFDALVRATMVKYNISCGRYGGEYVIGTLPADVAQYWSERDDFESYFKSWSVEDKIANFPNVPIEYRIEECWYEHDTILHENVVEFADSNYFEVTSDDIDVGDIHINFCDIGKDKIYISDDTMKRVSSDLPSNEVAVFSQSFEKGSFNFECQNSEGEYCDFILDEPFMADNIDNVCVTAWDDVLLLTSFQYMSYSFYPSDSDTIGKSFSAWTQLC